ncbi:hypothetical protein GGE07_006369 [Sinorhizobium terangae]|nr:hypothetical protein [Sinorhizobium terangae]
MHQEGYLPPWLRAPKTLSARGVEWFLGAQLLNH